VGKNVLVIDSGARGHALTWKLAQSRGIGTLFVAPGNGGTAEIAVNVPIAATDVANLAAFAASNSVHLTVVGQDDPLALGIVDTFQSLGLRVFGPTKAAAQIEASKFYAKNLMRHVGVPTAKFESYSTYTAAMEEIERWDVPVVIKASGLALGKGVYICHTLAEAKEALRLIMVERIHGVAGDQVVIEEFLTGTEFSAHALSDGESFAMFPPSQDYKRIGTGDTGPNTGGMGVVAPLPWITEEMLTDVRDNVATRTLNGLLEEAIRFTGCLYPGLMATKNGLKVLEFNARFGDPETQVYMMLLENDLLEVLDACVDGTLDNIKLKWSKGFAACVVLASAGYPGKYATGVPITLPKSSKPGSQLFHAGTKLDGNKLVTSGGRVFSATAIGPTLPEALARAYELAGEVEFAGKYFRTDIGANTLTLL
jgi:phosphoribosylamine---glycine ligase